MFLCRISYCDVFTPLCRCPLISSTNQYIDCVWTCQLMLICVSPNVIQEYRYINYYLLPRSLPQNSESSSVPRVRGLSFSIGDSEEEAVGVGKLNVRRRRQSSSSVTNGADLALHVTDILTPGAVPRQLSQTHSEPDSSLEPHSLKTCVERSVTWAEPRIKVIPPPSSGRSMLMAMHTEYTR